MKNPTRVSDEKSHALFAPSSAERYMACPGSIELSKKAPLQAESKYAAEGTAAHACLEYLGKRWDNRLQAADKARKKWGMQMVVHAEMALNHAFRVKGKKQEGREIFFEVKSDNTHIDKDFYGTADIVIVEDFGALDIMDYKYGAGVWVEVKENPQLIAYAIGVARQYDYAFDVARLTIIQPRAADAPETPIRTWEMPMQELLSWEKKFSEAIKAARKKDAPLVSGSHCHWCPAKLICPETSKRALEKARVAFAPKTGSVQFPTGWQNDPEILGKTLTALDLLDTWAQEVRNFAYHQLEKGKKIPGFKLVAKRGRREWLRPHVVQRYAALTYGADAFESKLKSPSQMEKLAGKKWVEKRCAVVSSGTTMVPDDDTRPAVNRIKEVFKDVD